MKMPVRRPKATVKKTENAVAVKRTDLAGRKEKEKGGDMQKASSAAVPVKQEVHVKSGLRRSQFSYNPFSSWLESYRSWLGVGWQLVYRCK